MNELLKTGQVVQTEISGQPCMVEKFLGGGGQGEVYQAQWAGGSFALKWYYPQTATTDQREALNNLVKDQQSPSEAFLWPLDMAFAPGVPGFGYIMRLREPRFKGLLDLMNNRIDPKFRVLVTVGLGLADSFFKLHAKGLCYRDISFGNAFFDPESGEVAICDNDNVTTNRSPKVSVLGTPEFMAPEIVRREALPSRQTDWYSLSVLLFFIFHIHHPLKGKRVLSIHCWDLPSQEKILGTEPLFIFDPDDPSNRAVDRSFNMDGSTEGGHNARALLAHLSAVPPGHVAPGLHHRAERPRERTGDGRRMAESAVSASGRDLLLCMVRKRELLRPRRGEGREGQAWHVLEQGLQEGTAVTLPHPHGQSDRYAAPRRQTLSASPRPLEGFRFCERLCRGKHSPHRSQHLGPEELLGREVGGKDARWQRQGHRTGT